MAKTSMKSRGPGGYFKKVNDLKYLGAAAPQEFYSSKIRIKGKKLPIKNGAKLTPNPA
jgi:hypothetical protein